TQRAEASIIDGDSRGQFGTRITMAVDNADSVRLLHPQASTEIVEAVVQFPVGRALFWQHRQERIMQCDFTEYEEYGRRLGLSPAADTGEEIIQCLSTTPPQSRFPLRVRTWKRSCGRCWISSATIHRQRGCIALKVGRNRALRQRRTWQPDAIQRHRLASE